IARFRRTGAVDLRSDQTSGQKLLQPHQPAQSVPGEPARRQAEQLVVVTGRRQVPVCLRRWAGALLLPAARISRHPAGEIHGSRYPPRVPDQEIVRSVLYDFVCASDLHRRPLARSAGVRIPVCAEMRLSEWVLATYFTYVTALSQILAVSPEIRVRTLIANGLLLGCYTALRWRDSLVAQHLRNWIPLALMLLAYKEMGWLAPAWHDHHLENAWIVWDQLLLRQWRLHDAIESMGPLLPSILELSYVLVYALPAFCMSMLYVYRRSRSAEVLLIIYLLGLFLSYVQFPFWPSEPPRIVFPGEDAPSADALFPIFTHWIL